MADNLTLNAGSGGDTAAADDIGGVKHQRVKLSVGADGAASDAIPVSNGLDTTAAGVQAVGLVGQLDDAATGAVTENQFAPVRISSRRALLVEGVAAGTVVPVSDGGGNLSIDDGGNSITVDGTVTATANAGTNLNTSALALEAGGNLATVAALSRAEDVAAAGGETGIPALAVRRDAASSGVSADGDWANLSVTSDGSLRVSGTISAATEYTEDAAAAADPVGGAVILVRKDTPATTVSADGDNIALRGSNYGAAYVTMLDGSGIVITGGTQYTEDAAAASDPVGGALIAVRRDTLTTSEVSADGDNVALKANSKGCLHVDTGQGVAHDAADVGNGVKLAAKAETSPKGITLVADADKTDLYADSDGMLMVKLNTSGADLVSEAVSNTDGNSTAFSNFGAVASTKNNITAITVFRTDSGTSLAYVDFRDGTAGSVLWRMPLPPNGGSTQTAPTPLFKTTANTALAFDVSAALTTVYISVSGYQSKV